MTPENAVQKLKQAAANAERQAAYRARKAAEQLTEVRGIFAHPDDHAAVKEAAAKIARKRQRAAKRLHIDVAM